MNLFSKVIDTIESDDMRRRISRETKQLMSELFAQGMSVAEIARRADVSYSAAYGYTKVRQRGYASRTDYYERLAREKGYASYSEYQRHLITEKGYASLYDYLEFLAKQKGFQSSYEYRKYLASRKQQQPSNQALGSLIKGKLAELGKSQRWLSEQLGVSTGAVSKYAYGRATPSDQVQKKMFEVFDLPYETLDDLARD